MTRPYRAYRWDEWLLGPSDEDGQHRELLVSGRDYDCSESTMSQQIRSQAGIRGLSASIFPVEGGLVVVTRAKPADRPQPSYAPANEAKAMRAEDEEFRSRERNA